MDTEKWISKLTLEEKAALLQGKGNWITWDIPRLGIPSIFLSDGPHGLRKQIGAGDHLGINESQKATCFPTSATVANSWDPELAEELGKALGEEAVATDVHVVLGPGLNTKRSPLCGRNFEYYSEDPYLSGKMAAAAIRGIQHSGAAACPKHFAANSQELRRMTTDSVVDERTLREIYLTGFEIAVKEGSPKTIMSSYNRVNGVYANENAHLLQDILRKDWGFDGFVMTDWGGSNDHVEGVRAGSALEMPVPGADSALTLIAAVKEGRISESVLDDRLRELLPVVQQTHRAVASAKKAYDEDAHHALAAKCAAESAVLLENDGLLPLEKNVKVAVLGDFARQPRYQGAGSSLVNPTRMENLADSLRTLGVRVVAEAPGFRRGKAPDARLLETAKNATRQADVVILTMGLDEISESEGMDREHLELPEAQTALLAAVQAVNPNIVLVLSGGAPFRMPPKEQFRAAVHGYLGGQAGALAMARILTGSVNPCGRLAETWPEKLEDTPAFSYYPGREDVAQYREGLYVGYRYYQSAGVPVRYPFGYGLSYTHFAYSDLYADARQVRFTVTNTGKKAGAEVAQVYISCRNSKIYRPKLELKGFQKVFLQPGESREVAVSLDDKAFRYFNVITDRFEIETANYDICVGANAEDLRLTATVRIMGSDAVLPEAELPSYASANIQNISDAQYARLLGKPLPQEKRTEALTLYDTVSRFGDAKSALARFLCRRVEQSICRARKKGNPAPNTMFLYNIPIRGMAQMTGGQITRQMAQDVVYAVNGHTFRGLWRFFRDYFRGRKARKAFLRKLQYPEESVTAQLR